MLVEQRLGDAGRLGDVVHGGGVEARARRRAVRATSSSCCRRRSAGSRLAVPPGRPGRRRRHLRSVPARRAPLDGPSPARRRDGPAAASSATERPPGGLEDRSIRPGRSRREKCVAGHVVVVLEQRRRRGASRKASTPRRVVVGEPAEAEGGELGGHRVGPDGEGPSVARPTRRPGCRSPPRSTAAPRRRRRRRRRPRPARGPESRRAAARTGQRAPASSRSSSGP